MAHIHIVDDDPLVRAALHRLLAEQGYLVTETASGRDAVEVFQIVYIDLFLLDMIMPEMDGIETIQALRQIDPEVRIVAMSAGGKMASSLYLQLARSMGVTHVLEKPFPTETLCRVLDAALGFAPQAPEIGTAGPAAV